MANDEFPRPQEPVIEHLEVDSAGEADPHSSMPSPPSEPLRSDAKGAFEAPTERSLLGTGKLAAIAGGTLVLGLVIGLLIGWFAFDDDGGKVGSRGDKDRMSQQGPPMGGQQRGDQKGGMMPGGGGRGDQMMPGGQGGHMMPGGSGVQGGQSGPGKGSTPSTPSTQATPQSMQQG